MSLKTKLVSATQGATIFSVASFGLGAYIAHSKSWKLFGNKWFAIIGTGLLAGGIVYPTLKGWLDKKAVVESIVEAEEKEEAEATKQSPEVREVELATK